MEYVVKKYLVFLIMALYWSNQLKFKLSVIVIKFLEYSIPFPKTEGP